MTYASTRWMGAALLALALAACSHQGQQEPAAGGSGAFAPAPAAPRARSGDAGGDMQAMLAYEHQVGVVLPADEIEPRMQAAKAACENGRFGACVVLDARTRSGDRPNASLGMRIVPAGVEPMIALAARDARLGTRSTHAEDLAVQVRDNALVQNRLRNEMARLQEFQQRRDLAVADMIALSRQLAEAQAQLDAAEREGAQHKRRIDTQKLTLDFRPPSAESGRGEIGQALRDFGGTLASGIAWTIRAMAFLLPVLVVLAVLVALWRRLRRGRASKAG
ncbi:MAG TPA: DUF4349 domain-containing protein [Luteimonas sp.]|nr:DUF4349 domain-containing protein [Luteimonas sp.]